MRVSRKLHHCGRRPGSPAPIVANDLRGIVHGPPMYAIDQVAAKSGSQLKPETALPRIGSGNGDPLLNPRRVSGRGCDTDASRSAIKRCAAAVAGNASAVARGASQTWVGAGQVGPHWVTKTMEEKRSCSDSFM